MAQDIKKQKRKPMPRWLKVTGWLFGFGTMILLSGVGALFWAVERTANSLPEYESMKVAPTGKTIRILASDETVLQTLGPAYGEWLSYDEIPDVMKNAMIAVEDRRYKSHIGVDPRALARVVYYAYKYRGTDKRLQGASTITQQAARTVFLSQSYTIKRKIKEMIIAMAMERKLDKEKILELYLNRVYLGGGAYGVDAAARKFFGHSAKELTLSEAALLAGLAKAPSDYAPSADTDASYGRMNVVLNVMSETGYIGKEKVEEAIASRPEFAEEKVLQASGARYFTDWITPQINAIVGERGGRVDVYTTFNRELQDHADKVVRNEVPKGAQGALVSIDEDGAILAMVGGTDYETSSYNRATQAQRQPGSAFKLFVYITALENGYRPDSPVIDAPITIAGWSPRNSNGGYAGTVSLRSAFAQSLNTVAVRIGQNTNVETIAKTAKRFGFSTRLNIDPAMVLGTSEAHLIDMTRAYATIGSGGVAVAPYGIKRILVENKEVYKHQETTQLLTAPQVAKEMTSLLRTAVAEGTGQAANIGRPVAGKTGTTSSGKDGWFIGFSSGITTGVWIGRDDAKPVPNLQGGRAPARIFSGFMRLAVKGRPVDRVENLEISENEEIAPEAGKENETSEENSDPQENEDAPSYDAIREEAQRRRPEDGKSRAVPMD